MTSLSGSESATSPAPAEIAEALTSDGEYVLRVDPQPHQRVVDVHWAAHQAGKMLGIKVRVTVERAVPNLDRHLTVTVRPRPKRPAPLSPT